MSADLERAWFYLGLAAQATRYLEAAHLTTALSEADYYGHQRGPDCRCADCIQAWPRC